VLGLSTPRRATYRLKTRLYSIIAFLGLLPMLGAALALVVMELAGRDDAALDRAARGTIHLERVNGLVYAVVMESRGIYMSAEWRAAEPFAKNLIRQLGELQDVAKAWKADAIASQQSSIEELSERIDQFVRFRTELVRLGREENTAAARAFGDNDANRTVRSALNDSLRGVAHAYEQEIGRARSQVQADEHDLLVILLALAGLGALALGSGLIFIKVGLLRPLLRTRDSMLRLAQGDLDINVDGRPRAAEIAEMAQAVEVFAARETGVVTRVEPRTIGRAVVSLGGGRTKVEDVVDPTVGFVITVKPGDKVLEGEPIASVFARDASGVKLGFEALERAVTFGDRLSERPLPLISHRVTKDGVEDLTRPPHAPKSRAARRA